MSRGSSFVRPGLAGIHGGRRGCGRRGGGGCFVSVFFAASHETTVFCLRGRRRGAGAAWIEGARGVEGGWEREVGGEGQGNKGEDRKREMPRLSAKLRGDGGPFLAPLNDSVNLVLATLCRK